MKPIVSVLALVILNSFAQAQPFQTNSEEKCTIEGVVVKSTTGEPLKKTVVTANWLSGAGEREQPRSARTQASGRFTLGDLSPGTYSVWANRDGYVGQAYGQRAPNGRAKNLVLKPGERVADLVFRLIPMGAITGRVYDEDGEPLGRVNVQALRYMSFNGKRQLNPVMSASTNDMGEYRLSGLMPGKYYLGATYTFSDVTDNSAAENYVPVYYPGTNEPITAGNVEVPAGEEVNQIDFILQPVPAVRVRGQVLNAVTGEPARGVGVSLARRDNSWSLYQSRYNPSDPRGNFELRGVPPGSYFLAAYWSENGNQYSGREPLEVGSSDVDGVTLVIGPGSELQGQLRVEGNDKLDLKGFHVSLQPREPNQPWTQPAMVEADGKFVFKNVSAGTFTITVCCPPEGFYLKAAQFGGEDALENGLTVGQTANHDSLDLLLSPGGGRVDGVVRHDRKDFTGALVLLVPEPNRRGQTRLYLTTGTGSEGRFVLPTIPPGDYKLFAWENADNVAYLDPDFLQTFERLGRAVRIEEGSKVNVELDLIPADSTRN